MFQQRLDDDRQQKAKSSLIKTARCWIRKTSGLSKPANLKSVSELLHTKAVSSCEAISQSVDAVAEGLKMHCQQPKLKIYELIR